MNTYRYFRLEGARDGLAWPSDHPLTPGTIIRLNIAEGDALPINAWNNETKDWVEADWTEVDDPARTSIHPRSEEER